MRLADPTKLSALGQKQLVTYFLDCLTFHMNSRHIAVVNKFNVAIYTITPSLGLKKFALALLVLPNSAKKTPQYVYAVIDHVKMPITSRKIVVKIVT